MGRLPPFTPALIVLAAIIPLAAWMMVWVRGLEYEVASLRRDREELERSASRRGTPSSTTSPRLAEELAEITRMARAAVSRPPGEGGEGAPAAPAEGGVEPPSPAAAGTIAATFPGSSGSEDPAAAGPRGAVTSSETAHSSLADAPPSKDDQAQPLFGPPPHRPQGADADDGDPALEQYRRHLETVHAGIRARFDQTLNLSYEQDLSLVEILKQRRDLLLDLYQDKQLPPAEVNARTGQIEKHYLDATERMLAPEQLPQFHGMYPDRRSAIAAQMPR